MLASLLSFDSRERLDFFLSAFDAVIARHVDNGRYFDRALRAFDKSMRALGLEQLDLYLIHQPFGDYYGSWRAMEKLHHNGTLRAIGPCTDCGDQRLFEVPRVTRPGDGRMPTSEQ